MVERQDCYTRSQGFVNYLSTIPRSQGFVLLLGQREYLSTIPCCTGISLLYVVHEFDNPTCPEDDSDYLATKLHS